MPAQKRTRSGDPKPQSTPQRNHPQDTPMTNTPPCGQPRPSSKTSHTITPNPPKPRTKPTNNPPCGQPQPSSKTSHTITPNPPKPRTKPTTTNTAAPTHQPTKQNKPPKRPLLPSTATISKRPLLHPSLPSPFASSTSQKTLYITASTPFIPACKRIRSLLVQVQKRAAQSASEARGRGGKKGRKRLEANGRLEARDVEAAVAEGAGKGKGKGGVVGGPVGGEEVFLKATGRAIPRALELGVKFQGEDDCRVRVEMGSVKAIDDVEMKPSSVAQEEDGAKEDEVPETRLRTLSTVTVRIGLV